MIKAILWIVYVFLLMALLPHTAWALGRFEPAGFDIVNSPAQAWLLAFCFEAAIAGLTHKLSRHIEDGKKVKGWARFSYRYLNAYSIGLFACVVISALANFAHAVEFAGGMKVIDEWGIPVVVYAIAFGAALPCVSIVFARVLSHVAEDEAETDPALAEAKQISVELRRQLRESESARKDAEARAAAAERRFDAAGDLFARLFSEDKKTKIIAIRETWERLPSASIAILADASPSYVSEVLNAEGESMRGQ